MPEAAFHFSSPLWLLALPVPVLVWLWLLFSATRHTTERYAEYADPHLLPYLLGMREIQPQRHWRRFILWTLGWVLLVLALAGPRWDYTDKQLFRPGSDLVILLDLSASMDLTDVAPSRLARARQEIEDLLQQNRHARVGLIAFASVAHVIAPLTEDGSSLRQQLPAISTDLVRMKGSRLTEALIRARQMLAGQPTGSSRHLLLLTDGDFGDSGHLDQATEMAAEGIHLHVLGIGSEQGAAVKGPMGRPLHRPGQGMIISRLDDKGLQQLATRGDGLYRRADFDNDDTGDILRQVARDSELEIVANEKTRVWNERFFWLLGIALLLLLPVYRRTRLRNHSGVGS